MDYDDDIMEREMRELRRESLRFKNLDSQEEATLALVRQLQEEEQKALGDQAEQRESLDFIKQLQAAEEKAAQQEALKAEQEARKLAQELESQQIQEKVAEPQVCKICLCEIEEGCFPLQGCQHFFHQDCLRQHLQVNLNQGNFPIKCPDDKCGEMVLIIDIKTLLDDENLDKFYKFSFNDYVSKHNKEVACCPTADCQFHFFRMPDDDAHFKCPDCKTDYCMECRSDWHWNMSCKEYQVNQKVGVEDEKFQEFVEGSRFKRCPNCGFWVEKVDGCEYIMCKCGKNFCYICGQSHVEHFCPFKDKIPIKPPRIIGGRKHKAPPQVNRVDIVFNKNDARKKNKRMKLPPVLARFLRKKQKGE